MKKRKRKNKREYSKIWVAVILTASLIDLNILIILDRMENLGIAIVTEVFAIFGGYMLKAYLGKKNEESNKMVYDLAKELEEEEL